jgi:hypothetical protein
MRPLLLLFVSGVLLAQKPIVITGTIKDAQTDEPAARVGITLRSAATTPNATVLGATTDAEGEFRFADVPVGNYMVSAERPGYLRMVYPAKEARSPMAPFPIRSGESREGVTWYVQPQAVVVGRVVDEAGDVVEMARVQVMAQGTGQLTPQASSQTNDLGEFRVSGLRPGRYLVVAERMQTGGQADGKGYRATFYPSATGPESAAEIVLKAGQTSAPAQIILQRGEVFKVKGRVVGTWARDQMAQLTLMPRRRAGTGQPALVGWSSARGELRPDGTFEVRGAHAGEYHLVLIAFGNGRPVEMGRTPVTVAQADVENVTLPVQMPIKVQGTMRVDGEGTASMEGVNLSLYPQEGAFGMAQGRVEANGTFQLLDVGRTAYALNLRAIPNTYVKRIMVGEKEAKGATVDFTDGATQMEITLGTRPAKLTGTVKRESELQAPGRVILLAEGLSLTDRFMMSTPGVQPVAQVDQEGTFTFTGLAPGKYRLLALEEYQFEPVRSKEIAEKLEAKMTTLELAEGATGTAALVQLSRKEMAEIGLDYGQ